MRHLLEQVPTSTDHDRARAAFATTHVDVVVLLDDIGRPVSTMDISGIVHAIRDSGLRVNVDTPVPDVLQRAIVRVPAQRFAPLVCVDDAGRYLGVVRMERLIEVQTRGDPD
jgi:hypothetical protein